MRRFGPSKRSASAGVAAPASAGGRVVYFYVVDEAGVLRGVMPTRRLILAVPTERVADIMIAKVTTVPATATVLEACEFFIFYRLLAFPVVDEAGRLMGVVDIDLYTDELAHLDQIAPVLRSAAPYRQLSAHPVGQRRRADDRDSDCADRRQFALVGGVCGLLGKYPLHHRRGRLCA